MSVILQHESDLGDLMMKAIKQGLEGLVLKDTKVHTYHISCLLFKVIKVLVYSSSLCIHVLVNSSSLCIHVLVNSSSLCIHVLVNSSSLCIHVLVYSSSLCIHAECV